MTSSQASFPAPDSSSPTAAVAGHPKPWSSDDRRPIVAIAGASGFVGTTLRLALSPRFRLLGLTRSPNRARQRDDGSGTRWVHCDLFSLREVREQLEGADYAIYLVHSMEASARLVQGDFTDLDLILADNFSRAAEAAKIRQIVYIGGLIPEQRPLSPHLASRLEVEETLGCCTTPLTSLRASLIVGAGGSSLQILLNLVRRLPVMIRPSWCRSRTQPIALVDVVRAVDACLGDEDTFGRVYDIGGPDVMSYAEMLRRTARVLGKRRLMFDAPFFSARLSKLWVSVVAQAPRALVGPLVESLRHDMVAGDNALQRALAPAAIGFDDALRASLDGRAGRPSPRVAMRRRDRQTIRRARRVRSVQRLPMPTDRDAEWVRREYARWLPRFVFPLMRCEVGDDNVYRFKVRVVGVTLLELTFSPEDSTPDRQLLYVTGGLLARLDGDRRGRLEFRTADGGKALIAAIHDFSPTLPWYLYSVTQAQAHLWVMRGFGRHLRRITGRTRRTAGERAAGSRSGDMVDTAGPV
ncbi:MAG: NAD(P)H-binding protein [Acidobacteriota bacterium]